MQTQKNGRGFEGPFILLGMLPAWPEELERRAGYKGPHVQLTKLLPIAMPHLSGMPTAPEGGEKEPVPEGKVIGGVNSDVVLNQHLSSWFLERFEQLIKFLDHPRTAKQCTKALDCSMPTAYALLELLRRRGFPLEIGKKGRAHTFMLAPEKRANHGKN